MTLPRSSHAIYSTLDKSIDTYLTKISSTHILNILPKNIIKRKLFYISETFKSGYAKVPNKKFQAVVLNAGELGIQFNTGQTNKIDKVIEELTRSLIIYMLNNSYGKVNNNFKLKLSKVIANFICMDIASKQKNKLDSEIYHYTHALVMNKLFNVDLKQACWLIFKTNSDKLKYETIRNNVSLFPTTIFGINYTPHPMVNFSEKYTRIIANMLLANSYSSRLNSAIDTIDMHTIYKEFINELISKSNKIQYDMSPIVYKTITEDSNEH